MTKGDVLMRVLGNCVAWLLLIMATVVPLAVIIWAIKWILTMLGVIV